MPVVLPSPQKAFANGMNVHWLAGAVMGVPRVIEASVAPPSTAASIAASDAASVEGDDPSPRPVSVRAASEPASFPELPPPPPPHATKNAIDNGTNDQAAER